MILIRQSRKGLGALLLIAIPAVILLLVFAAGPWWIYPVLVALAVVTGLLAFRFIANPPAIVVDADFLSISYIFQSIRIPMQCVKQARIVRPWGNDGRFYLLEVSLTSLPSELSRVCSSKRRTLRECESCGGYIAPQEPFLLLSISPLSVSDEEFSRLVGDQISISFHPA